MTTAFWSNTESDRTEWESLPYAVRVNPHQIAQVNRLGSPPGLLSAVPYCYRKNNYIIQSRMHLEAVTCVLFF